MTVAPMEVPVEIVELTPEWLAGGFAAMFARVQILVAFYDGRPRLWLEAIERGEAPCDDADVAFLESMMQRAGDDTTLIDDLRRIVRDFAARMG